MFQILLLISICGTAPNFGGDTLNCELENPSFPQNIVKVRLYRALRYSSAHPIQVDSLPTTSGAEFCFTGIDSTIQATYWAVPVNALGKVPCTMGRGLSFPRTVDVGDGDKKEKKKKVRRRARYDVQGRVMEPTRTGQYWPDTTVIK